MDIPTFLGKYGPIVTMAAGGLLAWGQLNSDVQELQASKPKLEETREIVIEMRANQRALKEKAEQLDKKVEKILDKLEERAGASRSTRRSSASAEDGEDVSR